MLEKIVFLCVNPWEGFRSPAFQSSGREYFQWICRQALLKNRTIISGEKIEVYGEVQEEEKLFSKTENKMQLLYVQSHREKLLEQVFNQADLVFMGIPGNVKEFENTFLPVIPWKDQILFLWEQYLCRDEKLLQQLCREYKLRESQMVQLKRGLNGVLYDMK